MRSIRFSDQVLAANDSYEDEDDGNGGLQMRSLGRRRAAYHYSKAPSIAASDTSSAAGFGRANLRRPFNTAALARNYSVDHPDGAGLNNALYPRSTQEFLDEYEYRGLENASSVTTGSPYSPRSADSSSYNYSNGGGSAAVAPPIRAAPILKNSGSTLPRPHSRASFAYGSNNYVNGNNNNNNGGLTRGRVHSMEFASREPQMMRPPSSLRATSSVINGNLGDQQLRPPLQANGSVVSSCDSSVMSRTYNRQVMNNNGRYFSDASVTGQSSMGMRTPTPARIIDNPMDEVSKPPKRTTSAQVIASRPSRPCCELSCLQRIRGGSVDENGQPQTTPIGVLFTIFLVFSFVVVSGVMLYLRGGAY